MLKGTIVRWKDDQGYGFIKPAKDGDEVFLHIKAFPRGTARPTGNEHVQYVVAFDERGRPRARTANYVGDVRTRTTGRSPFPLLVSVVFAALLTYLVAEQKIPLILASTYLAISLLTFIVYAHDKSAAISGRWRVPENTLLLLGLLCGWPGALVAQNMFRHKSRKLTFQVPFWFTVIINGIGLWWLTTPRGMLLLEKMIQRVPFHF